MKEQLSTKQSATLIEVLKARFAQYPQRHAGIAWATVAARLAVAKPVQLAALQAMEETGGEPDVIGLDPHSGAVLFFDCSPESPKGRTSLCYDRAGLDSRKEHKPRTSALEMAAEMGVELLTEEEYFQLQTLGAFDAKSSSWVQTPEAIRKLGGALYGDRRYGRVFIGHNGAQSYYGARGFRARLAI